MEHWRKLLIFMKTNLENYSLKELNNYTFDNLLDKKFYQYWKKYQDELALEIIFSPVCNQGCSYCYLNKDNQGIYSNQNFVKTYKYEFVFIRLLCIFGSLKIKKPTSLVGFFIRLFS